MTSRPEAALRMRAADADDPVQAAAPAAFRCTGSSALWRRAAVLLIRCVAWAAALVCGPLASVALLRMLGPGGVLLGALLCALSGVGAAVIVHETSPAGQLWPLTRRGVLRLLLARERAARQRAETDARVYRSMWLAARRDAVAHRMLERPADERAMQLVQLPEFPRSPTPNPTPKRGTER